MQPPIALPDGWSRVVKPEKSFESTASKEDAKALEASITMQLDRMETLLIEEQTRKIENLEARTKTLIDALAV